MSSVEVQRNGYGREIKEGLVFGYLCTGTGGVRVGRSPVGTLSCANNDGEVYRFGKTTKPVKLDENYAEAEQTKVFISRLGCAFGGLNGPEKVIFWAQVTDVHQAWDIVRDYLQTRAASEALALVRSHIFLSPLETERPIIVHEYSLGDKFFSIGNKMGAAGFHAHLKEVFTKLLNAIVKEE